MKNLYLFTGEEKFLLHQELVRWVSNFSEKFGKQSVFQFDADNFDASQILELASAGGLFSNKKLIIVKGVPLDTDQDNKLAVKMMESFTEQFMQRPADISGDVLMIMVSYKPDKRVKFYKFLQERAQIKEFNFLSSVQLKLFVKEQLGSVVLSDDLIDFILVKVGKDLFRIQSEVEKLCLWQGSHEGKLDKITIDRILFGQTESNAFLFFDYFFDDKKKATQVLDDMQEQGDDFNQALGALYWGFKAYFSLIDLYQQGIRDAKELTSITKLHPFVVSKNLKNIKLLVERYADLKVFYEGLIRLDYGIKSGKVSDTVFWIELKRLLYHF